jgi:hypothetical protein
MPPKPPTRRGFLASFSSGLLLGDAAASHPVQAAGAPAPPRAAAVAPEAGADGHRLSRELAGYAVFVDDFVKPGDRDDTPAIRAAIEAARRGGGPLRFAARVYNISETIEMPSGLNMIGAGRTRLRDPEIPGTVIRRTADVVAFSAKGVSVLSGAHLKHSISIRYMLFHGGDFASDFMQFTATAYIYITECFFTQTQGRHLLMWEVFDSRIVNTDFEWGGSLKSGTPMIELRSGGGYEFTNMIFFVNCRCESYPATALAITGNNTNKIFFTNCKFESGQSAQPALTLERATVVHFSPVQIFSRGPKDGHFAAQVVARRCSGLFGTLLCEHRGPGNGGAQLDAIVTASECQAVDLTVHSYEPSSGVPPENTVRFDGSPSPSLEAHGFVRSADKFNSRRWRAE